MLRVAAWRAGTDPDLITTVAGPARVVDGGLRAGACLVVLGVDLSAHPEVETATVSVLAGRTRGAVAVVRGHRPDLGAPLRGPVVVAGGPVVPEFAAEIAARLGAPVESVDIGASDAQTSLSHSWSGPIARGSSSSTHRTTWPHRADGSTTRAGS